MKIDDTIITSGGMLECCAHTLLRLADSNPRADYGDGATVMCRTGNPSHKLILFNGIWRWVSPLEAESEQRDLLRKAGNLYDHIRGRNRT